MLYANLYTDNKNRFSRRRMAVSTESGEVIIYEATVDGPGQFLECLVLDHECVIPPRAS